MRVFQKSSVSIFLMLIIVLQFTSSPDFNFDLQNENKVRADDITTKVYLYNVSGCFAIQALEENTGPFKFYMHVPIPHLYQAPVFLSIYSDPKEVLEDYRIVSNYPDDNSLLEVSVSNLDNTEIIYFFWSVPLLIEHNEFDDMPTDIVLSLDIQLPDEVKPWLLSTDFVQADNPEIVAKAEEFTVSETSIVSIVRNISIFTGFGITYDYNPEGDALSTLQAGYGTCIGKANLAAALLRSLGIPARTILVGPEPHYLIEFYLHPYGWVKSESSNGVTPPTFHSSVVTYCANPSDETTQSTINGLHPYNGRIFYWGTTNPSIISGTIYSRCSISYHHITTTHDNFESALNLTKTVWEYYKNGTDDESTNLSNNQFRKSIGYQKDALEKFLNDDFSGYVEDMTKALKIYDGTVSKIIITSSVSGSILLIGIFLATFFLLKKKRNRD